MISTVAIQSRPNTMGPFQDLRIALLDGLRSRHWWALTPTLLRLPLGVAIALATAARAETAAIAMLIAFVVVDVFDGVLARWVHEETDIRRAADSSIDKVAIHMACLAVMTFDARIAPFWGFLVVRDVLQAHISMTMIRRARLVVNGAGWHATYTSAVAVWGGFWIAGVDMPDLVSFGIVALGLATLFDYGRSCSAELRKRWDVASG